MAYIYRQPYPNELWHYGILGQKWGVRRYQNPDGSLTAAGKKRYDKHVKIMQEEGKEVENRSYLLTQLQNETFYDIDRIEKAKNSKEKIRAKDIKRSNDEAFKYLFEMQLNSLRRYKHSEDIVKKLGEVPMTYLEQYPRMKTFYQGSPYKK